MVKNCPARAKRSKNVLTTMCRIEGGRAKATAKSIGGNQSYLVTYGKGHETCGCKDYEYRSVRCKHILALMTRLKKTPKGKRILRTRRRKTWN